MACYTIDVGNFREECHRMFLWMAARDLSDFFVVTFFSLTTTPLILYSHCSIADAQTPMIFMHSFEFVVSRTTTVLSLSVTPHFSYHHLAFGHHSSSER
jgi:hypothetical protein